MDQIGVNVRFLLGPAGAGKTFLCLEEIRQALLAQPSGPPLLLLAPKQATFQLERQLLAEPSLPGYTRLHILSFERLADFVLTRLCQPIPSLLSENGRIMVLRALLARRREELRIFRASAAQSGFATQLSHQLRALQRRRLSAESIRSLASQSGTGPSLRRKLLDLALLLADYQNWLNQHHFIDADSLPDLATAALALPSARSFFVSALWLDGFAEITPQELNLLAALVPRCQKMTLAFCLENATPNLKSSWLSIWNSIGKTFDQCRSRLAALTEARMTIHILSRHRPVGRFIENQVLRHLEEYWTQPAPLADSPAVKESLRLAICASPADEAILAAREILRFVRAGGRWRETAVLLRALHGYHDHLRRVFSRYQIPFFLDRREPVAQHPLAELTRSALRAVAFGWRHEDWFGTLKTGLVTSEEESIDRLENEALARGWTGQAWFSPLLLNDEGSHWAERLRQKWLPPFAQFRQTLNTASFPDGPWLAQALRQLWRALDVQATLQEWSLRLPEGEVIHATVWEQLNVWLDDLALAFAGESMPLRDWLPILETGLSSLTIGVIPPALDQVLVGAIDRSRNPDLKLVLLLGVNETIFPAVPDPAGLLSEADREELGQWEIFLSPTRREFLSRERFLGYIACTRSRQRLVLACAEQDARGAPLNPSPFFSHLRGLFPSLEIERFTDPKWSEAEHACELTAPLLRVESFSPIWHELLQSSAFASLREQISVMKTGSEQEHLSPDLALQLYGTALRTSVSRLENFAACAFKFFIHSGLRAEERQRFELDARERGSFQHAVLASFHEKLRQEEKKWRDLSPNEAQLRVHQAVHELVPKFHAGLLAASAQSRFAARAVASSLQEYVATTVAWMNHYQFDPREVEMEFGDNARAKLPAWELDLRDGRRLLLRGFMDRVDLCRTGSGDEALAVVIDYKSSFRKLDKILMAHGLQLQLVAYLAVLRHLENPGPVFGVSRLIPAGVFYVNLRGQAERGETRTEVLARTPFQHPRYQHMGRFDAAVLPWLDKSLAKVSPQFNVKLKANGQPDARGADIMSSTDFRHLLDQVESSLIRMGQEIYEGILRPNPFQKGAERACDRCYYHGICRFDPWVDPYRVLEKPK